MFRKIRFLALGSVIVFLWTVPLSARYTLVLKNGRRITVQSYREEGGMIKFPALGGEIGIAKDQIQSIQKAGVEERWSLVVPREAEEQVPPPPTKEPALEEQRPTPQVEGAPSKTPEETLAEQRDKEEKEYQQKLKELTQQLRELRDRYAVETRGNTGPEPSFFTSEEAFRGHQEDLLSRLRAGQPPAAVPPPSTQKQQRLIDLRKQMNQLENERQRLIDEMKQKGFDTGSLFLE